MASPSASASASSHATPRTVPATSSSPSAPVLLEATRGATRLEFPGCRRASPPPSHPIPPRGSIGMRKAMEEAITANTRHGAFIPYSKHISGGSSTRGGATAPKSSCSRPLTLRSSRASHGGSRDEISSDFQEAYVKEHQDEIPDDF